MALDLEAFVPFLSGGGGAILISSMSKVWMSRENRAEKNEDAERKERKILMEIVQTQAESIGYMKGQIDRMGSDLKDSDRRHDECRAEMQELRTELGLNRESVRP